MGRDLARPATVQIGLDPLQITDVAIKPLGSSSTDMATISYMLTEAATVYVGIYSPGTSFTNINASPPVISSGQLLRLITEQKDRRTTVSTLWDGRDSNGSPVCDGDYVYAIWAELPSGAWTVRTSRTMVGMVPVARGLPLNLMTPSSTVIGSSPTAAGLDPFYFRYTPQRDALVNLTIKEMNGSAVVRRVVQNEVRYANFSNRDVWDGKNDSGNYVSSGTYLAELATTDPLLCSALKTSTFTAIIPVNIFRIVDVRSTALLGGSTAQASVSFELSKTMWIDLKIYPAGTTVAANAWPWETGMPSTVYRVSGVRPGRFRITEYWDGRDSDGYLVPDGRYPFTLTAKSSGTAGAQMMYATDKVSGYIDVTRGQIIFSGFDVIPTIPTMYNSSDVVKLPPYEITYALNRQSSVTVQVLNAVNSTEVKANIVSGGIRDGDIIYREYWDGKDDKGNYVKGPHNVRIIAEDLQAQLTSRATAQMTVDVFPLRIYDVSIVPLTADNPAMISYQVSEAMKVATKIYKPGTSRAGVADPGAESPDTLVKRIIGVRPARTQITEYWDGTDLTLSKVPDGTYVFQIYGSTDTSNINTLDGLISNIGVLADDVVTANIPLTKGGVADLCGQFNSGSYFRPNPYTGTSGRFRLWSPISGTMSLRLYNLAGDLVYKYDFGAQQGDNEVLHPWARVNTAGRTVAQGVYLAVLRFEATQGTREVCQTVKKILIP